MEISRRQFVALTVIAGATAAGACSAGSGTASTAGGGDAPPSPDSAGGAVDAGPATDYAADGVYDRFKDRGILLVRREGRLAAFSSVCTHRKCTLRAEHDTSIRCKCHGSTFDLDGKVTKGPAQRNLPRLPMTTDANGHLLVSPLRG